MNAKLDPVSAKLVDYNGNSIVCLSESFVNVKLIQDQFKGRLFITNDVKPLLGSDWIQSLKSVNWTKLLVGQVGCLTPSVNGILMNYDCF